MSTTEVEEHDTSAVEPGSEAEHETLPPDVRDRLLVPLLLPLFAVVFVAFFTINLSRVFLAGTGRPAVIVASSITVLILAAATLISASDRARPGNTALFVTVGLLVVLMAGLVTLGESQEKKEAKPAGEDLSKVKPDATFEVASGNLFFKPDTFDAPAGVLEVKVTNTGTHTFSIHQIPAFTIDLPKSGSYGGKVRLAAGKTYNFYCKIPGHEAAGMKGTLTVGAAGTAMVRSAPAA